MELKIGDKIIFYWNDGDMTSEFIVVRSELGLCLYQLYELHKIANISITDVRKAMKGMHERYCADDFKIIKANYSE